MRTNDQRRLSSVTPVLDFFSLEADLPPAILACLARLQGISTRTRALLAAILRARTELSAATRARELLTAPLRELLAQIVRLAIAAALQEGDVELRANLRFGALTKSIPLEGARAALDTAFRHRDLLLRYGMPDELLLRLCEEVDRYAATIGQRAEASAVIAAANADLAVLAREAVLIIRHLDALNQIRLAGDSARLEEWREVRSIRWSSRSTPAASDLGTLSTG